MDQGFPPIGVEQVYLENLFESRVLANAALGVCSVRKGSLSDGPFVGRGVEVEERVERAEANDGGQQQDHPSLAGLFDVADPPVSWTLLYVVAATSPKRRNA